MAELWSYEFWQENCHKSSRQIAKEVKQDGGNVRKKIRQAKKKWPDLPWYAHVNSNRKTRVEVDSAEDVEQLIDEYGVKIVRHKDGSTVSQRLVMMSEEQAKDPSFVLKAHGFDEEEWEIISYENKIWNVYSKNSKGDGHNISTLYSSSLRVKPKQEQDTWSVEKIREVFEQADIKPMRVQRPKAKTGLMLELGLVDLHFGNSDLEWYEPILSRLVDIICSKRWEHIIIPVGSDLFHADNFKNTTSNGTLVSSVDWRKAVEDARIFFTTLFTAALENSKEVYVYYVIGNHDESMTYVFCEGLSHQFPQINFDLNIDERKVHVFGDVAVGMTHGDSQTKKDHDRIFISEFPDFAHAKVREVHMAHFHHEQVKDQFGVVVRFLSSGARVDKWHREEGFVGTMRRVQLFEFDKESLRCIYYV